jgi:hypothetical protein
VRITVPPDADAVAKALLSLLIAIARLDAMLLGVVPEPDQLAESPCPETVIVVVAES